MSLRDDLLVWIDLEMTGLDPHENTIIEIASIITDSELSIIAEGPNIVINQPEEEYPKIFQMNIVGGILIGLFLVVSPFLW